MSRRHSLWCQYMQVHTEEFYGALGAIEGGWCAKRRWDIEG